MAKADLAGADFSSLRHCFGAGEPLNPEAMRAWKQATGCDIYDGYGQTETINIVANFPGMAIRPGSMGKPCPGLIVDVIDDEGQILPPNEVGHIAVKITDPYPARIISRLLPRRSDHSKGIPSWLVLHGRYRNQG
jgi:acetyl-CoA synthetase